MTDSVRRAMAWDDVPPEELLEDYPEGIFDSYDPHRRRQLDDDEVLQLPQVDEAGKPIHLYCGEGNPIQRRMATFQPHARPYGVLMKSERMQDLFTRNIEDLDDEQEGHNQQTFHSRSTHRLV